MRKGQIRNTVLNQVKALRGAKDRLESSRDIKFGEIEEHRGPQKAMNLKRQVSILDRGISHIKEAIKVLDGYKDVTVT